MDEYMLARVVHALLLFVFLFCGLLRSCDLWRFSGRDITELYPARREASSAYFAVMLLIPCVLFPLSSPATRILVRCFWILYIPVTSSIAFRKFFFTDTTGETKYPSPLFLAAVPAAVLVALFIMACADTTSVPQEILLGTAGVTGLFSGYCMIHTVSTVLYRTFGKSNIPDTHDRFPRRFALGISILPVLALIMAWTVFAADTPRWYTAIAATCTIAGMAVLAVILHPQRERRAVAMREKPIRPEKKSILSDAQLDRLERRIRRTVEVQCLYLDPGLNRNTLKEKLDINHSYLSEVFTQRFGSLNRYVNMLRMKHAVRYADEHPEAKLTEVAQNSGFGSMNTFYRTKKLYEAGELRGPSDEND